MLLTTTIASHLNNIFPDLKPSPPHLPPLTDTILHYIQPNYTLIPRGLLTTSSPFIANYIGPAPPPGSAPHQYTFFLCTQWRKTLRNWHRMRFGENGAEGIDCSEMVVSN
ncbi:uncharacterized protein EAF01_002151 [Botrytis porri]|uniref:uncharacterized protein n=1 Tax=Botrytis porri TaxID=87229 RepID=UPI0018FF86FD|nr:uncharacterized protein EAF01_002151 [Botrytis porri]KAF7910641.1 hypothetical protein EAF01_002151 [Botrytis porri]